MDEFERKEAEAEIADGIREVRAVNEKLLTLREILAAQDSAVKIHPVPEWGGNVRIRRITVAAQAELDEWRTLNSGHSDNPGGGVPNTYKFMVRFIAACLLDESDELLLKTDADCDALLDRNAEVVGSLFLECRLWNGWNPDEDESGN